MNLQIDANKIVFIDEEAPIPDQAVQPQQEQPIIDTDQGVEQPQVQSQQPPAQPDAGAPAQPSVDQQ